MSPYPSVAVIILNWNGAQDTLECLDSLTRIRYPNAWVIVVDNGSSDRSVELISQAYPHFTLIQNGQNLGYAAGNNVGIRYALSKNADYILLLNNDTVVAPDFLDKLIDVIDSNPGIGMASPMIYYHSHPQVVWSAGGLVNWKRGSTENIGLNQTDTGQFGLNPCPVDFVTGCALLARREVIEQVGALDERFFAYYEEVEWCIRASRAGSIILLVPQAKIWHKISADARAASPLVHYYMTRNRLLFLKATRAKWKAWLNTLFLDDLRTLISWTIRPKWREKRPQRNMMVRALWDYTFNRFGKAPYSGS